MSIQTYCQELLNDFHSVCTEIPQQFKNSFAHYEITKRFEDYTLENIPGERPENLLLEIGERNQLSEIGERNQFSNFGKLI